MCPGEGHDHETPINEIKISVQSWDDIPALLLGLQHLYVSCREELEELLRRHVTAGRDDPEHAQSVGDDAVAGKPPWCRLGRSG